MQILAFMRKNFDVWSNKMKNFLYSKNLRNFVEFGFEDSRDEANDALRLYFIQESLDDSYLFQNCKNKHIFGKF